MENSSFILIYVIGTIAIFMVVLITTKIVKGRSYTGELTIKQLRDYFFKKYYCMDCNTRLKRGSKDDLLSEGWTNNMGTYSYSKNYKRTYFLKCPACNRTYTSDDF